LPQQLHKRLTTEQVTDLLDKYLAYQLKAKEAHAYLDAGRTRFYQLVAAYEEEGSHVSIEYERSKDSRRIDAAIERSIRRELAAEKKLIDNKDVPVRRYNYSYVRDQLLENYDQRVSVDTIIRRA